MAFTMNRNWIESVKLTAPEYATDLIKNLEIAMSTTALDVVDAHACALAAAMSSGDAIAFEISVSKELFGNDIRDAVARAVLFETTNARYSLYSITALSERAVVPPHDFCIDDFTNNGGSTREQFTLFCLVTAIVNQSEQSIRNNIDLLLGYGVSQEKIQAAARIACVIPPLAKCVL